ncbi:MAG: crossover junction endodeoxyribonuclease RuvC, partial [Planctomycetota bacterium]
MVILGIDPGTRIIGYGIIQSEGSKLKVITYGVIKTMSCVMRNALDVETQDPRLTDGQARLMTQDVSQLAARLLKGYQELFKIIKQHKPDEIAIETVFYSQDVQATIKIGEARGIALLAAAMTKTPVYEYSPAEVKKSVTGNGRADKSQVAEMVKHLLSLDT